MRTVLAVLGVVGQVLAVLLLLVGTLRLVGVRAPLEFVRSVVWGYELWLAFVVAAVATAGSLFFSISPDAARTQVAPPRSHPRCSGPPPRRAAQ